MNNSKQLLIISALVIAMVLGGALGYMLIEGWDFFDGLYMTVITFATIGYGETHELSLWGRIYTMGLIFIGTGLLAYAFSTITAYIVSGDLTQSLRKAKMKNIIRQMRDHLVVCGEGDTERCVIDELLKTGRDFVVVTRDEAKAQWLAEEKILHIVGNPAHESTLMEAGIDRARGMISSFIGDADNLFVVLTAKSLNPGLRIVSRCVSEESRKKIRHVGADSVVMPDHIGGLRMVSEMVRPGVVSFLDTMLRDQNRTIRVEEIIIPTGSPYADQPLELTGILRSDQFSIIALVRPGEPNLFNPPPSLRLHPGDRLVAVGISSAIQEFNRRFASAP